MLFFWQIQRNTSFEGLASLELQVIVPSELVRALLQHSRQMRRRRHRETILKTHRSLFRGLFGVCFLVIFFCLESHLEHTFFNWGRLRIEARC